MDKERRMSKQLNGMKKVFRSLLIGPPLKFVEYRTRIHMEPHILYIPILKTLK